MLIDELYDVVALSELVSDPAAEALNDPHVEPDRDTVAVALALPDTALAEGEIVATRLIEE